MYSKANIESLIAAMEKAAIGGSSTFGPWYDAQGGKTVAIEFPSGELFNEGIRGYIIAWRMIGKLQNLPIDSTDRFNAQGLEGKIRVHTSLCTALTAYRELPSNRCQIREAD